MKEPIVVQTKDGWEPAFWFKGGNLVNENGQIEYVEPGYIVEPGFAKPTKKEAQNELDKSIEQSRQCEANNRRYSRQYDYACGYHD